MKILSWIPSRLGIALSVVLFTLCWNSTQAHAQRSEADRFEGVWLTQNGRSKVEIKRDGGSYVGTIVWMQNPTQDAHNPNPSQRQKPLVGTEVLRGFTYDGKGAWTGGKVYAPEKGLLLDAKLTLPEPGTVVLQVSTGIGSKKITWTRADQR